MALTTHDGETLRLMLKDSGMTAKYFAEMMKLGRNTPARWFENPILPDQKILEAARALKMDAGAYFPRLRGKFAASLLPTGANEPRTPYGARVDGSELRNCREELAHWQGVAYANLEKYTNLLAKYNELLLTVSGRHGGGGAGTAVAHSLASTP